MAGCGDAPFRLQVAAMASSNTEVELRCVLHWFQGWSEPEKETFLKSLVEKAVPHKVCTLVDAMTALDTSMEHQPPDLFKCQMKLLDNWFENWSDEVRNRLMHNLEKRDPAFVNRFNLELAATAGQP